MKNYILCIFLSLFSTTIYSSLPPLKKSKALTVSSPEAKQLATICAKRDFVTAVYTLTTLASRKKAHIEPDTALEYLVNTFQLQRQQAQQFPQALQAAEMKLPISTEMDTAFYHTRLEAYTAIAKKHDPVTTSRVVKALDLIRIS